MKVEGIENLGTRCQQSRPGVSKVLVGGLETPAKGVNKSGRGCQTAGVLTIVARGGMGGH